MTTNTEVKAPNYSEAQEAAIIAASPLDLASATILAASMGKSPRSVISKAKSLGLVYNCKPKPAKRPSVETKAEIVAEIMEALPDSASLDGLEKSTTRALVNLRQALQAV